MSRPTRVLFVCRHNAGRSQLAAGLMRAKMDDSVVVSSGGLEPAAKINRAAVDALLERGIDISDQVPAKVTEADIHDADVIVSLVADVELPVPAGARLERWSLPDPTAWDASSLQPLVDDLDRRVTVLLNAIKSR